VIFPLTEFDSDLETLIDSKCGHTADTVRMLFGAGDRHRVKKVTINDIPEMFSLLNVNGFLEVNIELGKADHVFTLIKHGDIYLMIDSFIFVYGPTVRALDKRNLIVLFTDMFELIGGKLEIFKKYFTINLQNRKNLEGANIVVRTTFEPIGKP
jgi:hypothetical protein